jgi:hypothetical protein
MVGFRGMHRWLYWIGGFIVVAGLAALAVAVNEGLQEWVEGGSSGCADAGTCDVGGTRTAAWIFGVALLVCGLLVIWLGTKLRNVIERVDDAFSVVDVQGDGATPAGFATLQGFEGFPGFEGLFEMLSKHGVDLDPQLFEHAHVTTSRQTIDLSEAGSGMDETLRQRGRSSSATVEAFQPFMQLGDRTVAMAQLRVSPVTGGDPYEATVHGFVPTAVAERLTQGTRVPVLVDPDRPENVLVEWDRA